MTPVCVCVDPDPVTEKRKTSVGTEYTITYCRKCGNHYDTRYGSRPVHGRAEEKPRG